MARVLQELPTARAGLLLLAVALLSCGRSNSGVEFLTREGHTFSRAERRVIEDIAHATIPEVKAVLPCLPDDIVIRVHAASDVSDLLGASGSVVGRNIVYWRVDPRRADGVVAIARAHLRRTLYHELHHLARRIGTEAMPGRSVIDGVIHEGMASVFARDYAGAEYPWVQYPDDVSDWVKELLTLPDTAHGRGWMFRHPDGRRWIGYRTGAYLVDRAIKASGLSAAELVSVPPEDIVRIALETD